MALKHNKISLKSDTVDPSIIQPSDWNDDHVLDTAGIIHTLSANGNINSIAAGQNYFAQLRRKFNASANEEYEFENPISVKSSDYDFESQSPSVNLIANINNSITLTPIPLGINGTNTEHYIRIIDGVAGNEVCKITGGTAVSGAASGTITFVPTLNHTSGNWTIKSATAGIQEALFVFPPRSGTLPDIYGGGIVLIPQGSFETYAPITIRGHTKRIIGAGQDVTHIVGNYTSLPIFKFDGAYTTVGTGNAIRHLSMRGTLATSIGLQVDDQAYFDCSNVGIYYTHIGLKVTGIGQCFVMTFRHMAITPCSGDCIYIDAMPGAGNFYDITLGGDQTINSNGIHIVNGQGQAFRQIYTIYCGNSVLVDPTSTDVLWTEFVDCYFDASYSNCFAINPSGTGKVIGMKLTHCAFAFTQNAGGVSAGHGVLIGGSNTVCGIRFLGCISIINSGHGYWLVGTAIEDINFTDCYAVGNSAGQDGIRNGMQIEKGSNINILGGIYAQAWTQANSQGYGAAIDASVVNCTIIGAVLTPNNIANFSNGSSTTRVYHCRGSIAPGLVMVGITIGASPFTYIAGHTPETIYINAGTVSLISVNGAPMFDTTGKTVHLEPHHTVTVTYSVAPFMTKQCHV